MTKDEKDFVRAIVDLDSKVNYVKRFVKENFNIDAEYDDEANTIKLVCPNVNESLSLVSAKAFIYETIGEEYVQVIF